VTANGASRDGVAPLDPATSPRSLRRWRVLACVHAAAVVALGAVAIQLHGMYCENVGCIGRGIAWAAWACASAVALATGLVAAWRLRRGTWSALTRAMLAVQLLPVPWLLWRWLSV